jgi:hypothetical protein
MARNSPATFGNQSLRARRPHREGCHPEAKRLATLAYWKEEKRVAEFFERWPADADRPVEAVRDVRERLSIPLWGVRVRLAGV